MKKLMLGFALAVLTLAAALAAPLRADDLYGLGVRIYASNCGGRGWYSRTIFYNPGSADLEVSLLGVSNGALPPFTDDTLAVPAGSVAWLQRDTAWWPLTALWVYHLDVPPSLVAESSLYPAVDNHLCPGPPPPLFLGDKYGKASLPTHKALAPGGKRQLLPGLTLGQIPGTILVAVYNAGNRSASARIEIHRSCDGSLVDSRTVSVPADTVAPFGGFAAPASGGDCFEPGGFSGYATVIVGEPSLVWAVMLPTDRAPVSTIAAQ